MELSHSDSYIKPYANSSASVSNVPYEVHRNAVFNSFVNDMFVDEPGGGFMEKIKMFKVSIQTYDFFK